MSNTSQQPTASSSIKQNVLRLLGNTAINKINFDLNGIVVTGQRFHMIANAVGDSRIGCVFPMDHSPSDPPPQPGLKILARYIFAKNQIQCPVDNYGGTDASEQLVLVHESTHAILDMFMPGKAVLARNDEAAAFLAQMMYARLTGLVPNGPLDSAKGQALMLADKILQDTSGRTVTISEDDSDSLITAVKVLYGFGVSKDENGWISDRTNEQSSPDGVR